MEFLATPTRVRFFTGKGGIGKTSVACAAVALTVHLITPQGRPGGAFLGWIAEELAHRFGIVHATVQIELGAPGVECRLAPHAVV